MLWIRDSLLWIPDSLSVEAGLRILPLAGFRIPQSRLRIPKPRIPDSTSKDFLDSAILIPLHGASDERGYFRENIMCKKNCACLLAAGIYCESENTESMFFSFS